MARCLIALGSNLGDRADNLRGALSEMARLAHVRLLLRSRWHETVPIGGPPGQRAYLNGALLLETQLPASELLEHLLEIESRLGRHRGVGSHGDDSSDGICLSNGAGLSDGRWSPRTVDLDLLLYEIECCESRALQLPHPRMSYRRFVLEPAVEIAGWMPHPTSGSVLARLLWQLNKAGDYVVIVATGKQASARQSAEWLTHELALTLGCCWWQHEGPVGSHLFEGALIGGLLPCGGGQSCAQDGEKLAQKPNPPSLRRDGSMNIRPVNLVAGESGGRRESAADRPRNCETLPAQPKLTIAWEKRAIKDRMEQTGKVARGEDRIRGRSGAATWVQNSLVRGPMALILTADPRQALAEALAAIQSIWPSTSPHA